MKFRLKNEEVTFNICRFMRQSGDIQSVSAISYMVENPSEVQIEERLDVEALVAVIMNFNNDHIEEYESLVAALNRGDVRFKPKKLELDMKHRESPPTKPYIEESLQVELKALPSHLRYVFLRKCDTLPVVIASDLNMHHVESLVEVLKKFKIAIGWTIADIIGIPPRIFPHKIKLIPDHKPSIEHQRRLNPPMQEVVKKEIIKWLDAGVIYPIAIIFGYALFSVYLRKGE